MYKVFGDFSKAFDTFGKTGLWQLLRKYCCPAKITTMIDSLYNGMMANVSVGGEDSESFIVTNGVKQGCVLAPRSSPSSYQQSFYILSIQSSDIFNVAHLRAKTNTTWILMRGLLFAHDSTLVTHSAQEMQKIVDGFSIASNKFGLKINIKKDRGAVPNQLYKNPRGGYHG